MKKLLLLLVVSTSLFATEFSVSGESNAMFFDAQRLAMLNAKTKAQDICRSNVERHSPWRIIYFTKEVYRYSHYGLYNGYYDVKMIKATANFKCIF